MYTFKTTALGLLLLLSATILKAQTADEILDKHINAIGGRNNWNKVHSISMSGTLSVGGQVADFSTTVVDGKGFRQDFSLSGVTGYKIITPAAGWVYVPGSGDENTKTMTPAEVKEGQDQLSVKGNLLEYKGRGARVEYIGKEKTEGKECYKLKLTEKTGKVEWLYISQDTYYLVSSLNHVTVLGHEMDVATVYKDYMQQPEGVVIATTITTNGSDIHFATIAINKPVDDNIFKPATK